MPLTDGDPVTQWNDISGNDNHATQDAGIAQTPPTYRATGFAGGLPCVEFGGGSNGFRIACPTNGSFSAYYLVSGIVGSGAGNPIMDGVVFPFGLGIFTRSTQEIGAHVNTSVGDPTFIWTTPTWDILDPHLYGFVFSKELGFWQIYLDDADEPFADHACAPQVTQATHIWIGVSAPTTGIQMKMAEGVWWDTPHIGSLGVPVRTAILNAWGLA
jgi:hypothetical protein